MSLDVSAVLDVVKSMSLANEAVTSAALAAKLGTQKSAVSSLLSKLMEVKAVVVTGQLSTGKRGRPATTFGVVEGVDATVAAAAVAALPKPIRAPKAPKAPKTEVEEAFSS
jgi:predicted ArsR family transcriptional regulator